MKDSAGHIEESLAVKFFRQLLKDEDWGSISKELETMMEREPKLLECRCPEDDELADLDWVGCTATEVMCKQFSAGSRDLLYELVKKGAKATEKCYEIALRQEEVPMIDHIEVLLLTGIMPVGEFFLDYFMPTEIANPSKQLLQFSLNGKENYRYYNKL